MAILLEMTKKREKEYNRRKKLEEFKRKLTLFKAKLLRGKISPDDTRTIQVHPDTSGALREYYIKNPYLQEESCFGSVLKLKKDFQNNNFVYRGIVKGADNAIGILQSNVELSEIVSDPHGNVLFQEILSQENAEKRRTEYYDKIGESQDRVKGHDSYYANPDFVLGTILKDKNGKFTYSSEVGQDVEQLLADEREEDKKNELMRNKESVEINVGRGFVIAKQNCWLEQGKKINYAGINASALYYKYEPQKVLKTDDNKYVYLGTAQIGEPKKVKEEGAPIQLVTPFVYEDVILWTEGKNLTEYFLNKKLEGLNLALGEIFLNERLKDADYQEEESFIGGIVLDENGKCKSTQNIPETVRETIKEYRKNKQQEKTNKIIKFDSQFDTSSR